MLYALVSQHFLNLIAFCSFVYILLCLVKCRYNESIKVKRGDSDKMLQQPAPTVGTKLVFFANGDGGYSVKELMHSTSKVLWKGTFGTSFKTELKGGNAVVVRRLKDTCSSDIEFRERVQAMAILLHENLLPLRAYCCHQNEKFLVYDYMRMGSLTKHLHGKSSHLTFPYAIEITFFCPSLFYFAYAQIKILFGVADTRINVLYIFTENYMSVVSFLSNFTL